MLLIDDSFICVIAFCNSEIIEYYRFNVRIVETPQNVAFIMDFKDVLGFLKRKIAASEFALVKYAHHAAVIKQQKR